MQSKAHWPPSGDGWELLSDSVAIRCADCYTLVKDWPSDAALVTDPPYGIEYVSFGGRGVAGPSAFAGDAIAGDAIAGDANPFDPLPFLGFATVCLWGANHFAPRLPTVGKWLVWDKRCGVTPERMQADCELAWCNQKGAARVFRHVWDGMIRDSERGPRVHPMQKPVSLLEWCLGVCGVTDGLVIDPFMGSGSMGIACIRAGLRYMGVEIAPEHYATARERLKRELAQGLLPLADAKPETEHATLL
jgi:hypothetical protein